MLTPNSEAFQRRSSNDPQWSQTKMLVDKRDHKLCRLMRCITVVESKLLKVGSPKTIDRCHIFKASVFIDHIYNIKNIVSLQRYIHHRMDNYENPLDGTPIDLNETWYWWYRIYMTNTEKYDKDIDYELILRKEIGII